MNAALIALNGFLLFFFCCPLAEGLLCVEERLSDGLPTEDPRPEEARSVLAVLDRGAALSAIDSPNLLLCILCC